MTNIEYILNILIFNKHPWTIHKFFSDSKIGYGTAQTCAHLCRMLHYNGIKIICCKSKWKNIYRHSVLFKSPTKSVVIDPFAPTPQHNVNSSCHVLIKRHANMFTKNWHTLNTNPPTVFGYLFGGVIYLFKRRLRSA